MVGFCIFGLVVLVSVLAINMIIRIYVAGITLIIEMISRRLRRRRLLELLEGPNVSP